MLLYVLDIPELLTMLGLLTAYIYSKENINWFIHFTNFATLYPFQMWAYCILYANNAEVNSFFQHSNISKLLQKIYYFHLRLVMSSLDFTVSLFLSFWSKKYKIIVHFSSVKMWYEAWGMIICFSLKVCWFWIEPLFKWNWNLYPFWY